MPIPVFNPPIAPDNDIGYEAEPRVLRAEFGDGYNQRALDGLNAIRHDPGEIAWNNLFLEEADAIVAFFEARQGVEVFYWTNPGDGVQRKYLCSRWSKRRRTYSHWVVTATLREEFDL